MTGLITYRQVFYSLDLEVDTVAKGAVLLKSNQDLKADKSKKKDKDIEMENAEVVYQTSYDFRATRFVGDEVVLPDIKAKADGGSSAFVVVLNDRFVIPEVDKGISYLPIIVRFIVESDGTLSRFSILKDPGFRAGEEAVRVLKEMPKWIPAYKNDVPVRSTYILSIILAIP